MHKKYIPKRNFLAEDEFSVSSFGSQGQDTSNNSIQAIAQKMEKVPKYQFEVFEPETPGRSVSSMFIVMYSLLGMTILIMTIIFNFGMLLLLAMIGIVFIVILILTNCSAMMHQI